MSDRQVLSNLTFGGGDWSVQDAIDHRTLLSRVGRIRVLLLLL
jgi:hypothetical protein